MRCCFVFALVFLWAAGTVQAQTTVLPENLPNWLSDLPPFMDCSGTPSHTGSLNYVKSTTVLIEGVQTTTDVNTLTHGGHREVDIAYLDGFGRPIQNLSLAYSPSGKALVQPIVYDVFGRTPKQYLPFTEATPDPSATPIDNLFVADAFDKQCAFYSPHTSRFAVIAGTGVPFSESVYEASPLNRVLEQAAPGESWMRLSGNIQSTETRTNTVADAVRYYSVTLSGGAGASGLAPHTASLRERGFFAANQLLITESRDEDNKTVWTFTNKEGQMIMQRQEGTGDTYYVYNDLGQLSFVLPPRFTLSLGSATLPTLITNLAFQYRYDQRGRLAAKRLPGMDASIHIIFDGRDRPVMQKQPGVDWEYTKYDALNRPIMTGLCKTTRDIDNMRIDAEASTVFGERRNSSPHLYTNESFPIHDGSTYDLEVLTVQYYDDYSGLTAGSEGDVWKSTAQKPISTKGLSTWQKVKVLGSTGPGIFRKSYTHYDERLRPVELKAEHELGLDLTVLELAFDGKLLSKDYYHRYVRATDTRMVRRLERNVYSSFRGRLERIEASLWYMAKPKKDWTLARYTYNELGQMINKKLHSEDGGVAYGQDIDYRYNIRGWLTAINQATLNNYPLDLLGMELFYDYGYNKNHFNGNLSGVKWISRTDMKPRSYGYQYDRANRLLKADFAELAVDGLLGPWNQGRTAIGAPTYAPGNYSLYDLSYDVNGNILTMKRNGLALVDGSTGNEYRKVDDLEYSYKVFSNELEKIDDITGSGLGFLANDFKDRYTGPANDYTYDARGNQLRDRNKRINPISYNHLNLVESVSINTNTIDNTYLANGTKVRKQSGADLTQYVGEAVYENGTLSFLRMPEGRLVPPLPDEASVSYPLVPQYEYLDHLGNSRLIWQPYTSKDGGKLHHLSFEKDSAAKEDTLFRGVAEARHKGMAMRGAYSGLVTGALERELKLFRGDSLSFMAFVTAQKEQTQKPTIVQKEESKKLGLILSVPPLQTSQRVGEERRRHLNMFSFLPFLVGKRKKAEQNTQVPEQNQNDSLSAYLEIYQDQKLVARQNISSVSLTNYEKLFLTLRCKRSLIKTVCIKIYRILRFVG